MAPVEFEKKIKEELEERRLQPSADSWDRVASQLKSSDRKRTGYWPYAVAAALAVLFFSGLWMVRDTNTGQWAGDVVVEEDTPSAVEDEKRPEQTDINSIAPELLSESGNNIQQPEEKIIPETQQLVNTEIVPVDMDPLINEKLLEVVAEVRILEEDRDSLTNAEVDLLLDQARQELLAEVNPRGNDTVDHQNLLTGVEMEIDKTFRDQVFEKLKQGFVKVRTAVASRND